jgi:hypothetical protein
MFYFFLNIGRILGGSDLEHCSNPLVDIQALRYLIYLILRCSVQRNIVFISYIQSVPGGMCQTPEVWHIPPGTPVYT